MAVQRFVLDAEAGTGKTMIAVGAIKEAESRGIRCLLIAATINFGRQLASLNGLTATTVVSPTTLPHDFSKFGLVVIEDFVRLEQGSYERLMVGLEKRHFATLIILKGGDWWRDRRPT